jgi:hypothetical protein
MAKGALFSSVPASNSASVDRKRPLPGANRSFSGYQALSRIRIVLLQLLVQKPAMNTENIGGAVLSKFLYFLRGESSIA